MWIALLKCLNMLSVERNMYKVYNKITFHCPDNCRLIALNQKSSNCEIFACCFVWVWNLVAYIAGGKEAEGVWEHGVEENIWT